MWYCSFPFLSDHCRGVLAPGVLEYNGVPSLPRLDLTRLVLVRQNVVHLREGRARRLKLIWRLGASLQCYMDGDSLRIRKAFWFCNTVVSSFSTQDRRIRINLSSRQGLLLRSTCVSLLLQPALVSGAQYRRSSIVPSHTFTMRISSQSQVQSKPPSFGLTR